MASEYDPRPAGTVALILDTVMGIGKHECANLDETYKTIGNSESTSNNTTSSMPQTNLMTD